MNKTKGKEHRNDYDLLRIIAIAFVIYNHMGNWGYMHFTLHIDLDTMECISWIYWPEMVISMLCKTAVPLFFMISGSLLLGKEETFGEMLKRRMSRIVAVLFIFSLFYYLAFGRYQTENWKSFFRIVYSEGMINPFWFLYSYMAYLLLLPLLRSFVKGMEKKHFWYLLGLVTFFQGILPAFQDLVWHGSLALNPNVSFASLMTYNILYPVIGYGFTKYHPGKKETGILVAAAVLSIFPSVILANRNIVQTGNLEEGAFCWYFESFRQIQTVGIYTGIGRIVEDLAVFQNRIVKRSLQWVGGCVFGIYLTEQAVHYWFTPAYPVIAAHMPDFIACCFFVFLIFAGSLCIVSILRCIPGIKTIL